ncbi:hypothetical protein V2J09_016890 [Rumex salicifolius]
MNTKPSTKEEDFGGIAIIYITYGSSAESKESPKSSSKASKYSSVNTVEINTKAENAIPVVDPKTEQTPAEVTDQARNIHENPQYEEMVKEVMTPIVEDEFNVMPKCKVTTTMMTMRMKGILR